MKLYERIENNNFDEIDKNRAIELIEGGNGHLVYNENYFKLQKENEELKANCIPIQKIKDKIRKNEEIIDISNDGDLIHELYQENKVFKELLESEE